MFRLSKCARAFALGLLMTLLSFSYASAHCFVGARFFPATLATDDPCVADEMSLPTVAWFKTGDNPPAGEVDISVDISKRITENFGVSIGATADRQHWHAASNAHILIGAIHANANIRPVRFATWPKRSRRARTCHAHECQPTGRWIGWRGAAPDHAFIHARSRAFI
jgi:hypothetical protein